MKRLYEFPWYQRLLLMLIWAIEKKIYKRDWTYQQQVSRAVSFVREDSQWMAHDKKVSAVSKRHLELLKDTWYSSAHTGVSEFRSSLGLDHHTEHQ